ncbi:hypothetical protein VCRA2120E57_970009 [Vibrio crassostreae]|nr:hypothetical protein VCRA2120E57_970009 [Vibrio crassostreae]
MFQHNNILQGELATEYKTVIAMVHIYCKDHHGEVRQNNALCEECEQLLRYAETRLDRCPYGEAKRPPPSEMHHSYILTSHQIL